MGENNGFKVEDETLWITEVRNSEESGVWVYEDQSDAIDELMNHVDWDSIDLDDIDMEDFFSDYSVQEVNVGDDEYSVQSVSPHKILFARIKGEE